MQEIIGKHINRYSLYHKVLRYRCSNHLETSGVFVDKQVAEKCVPPYTFTTLYEAPVTRHVVIGAM